MNRYLNPTIDVVFKLLLGSPETKECLIALLTAVLRPASPIADVEVINPEIAKDNIDDKGIVLDLLVMSDDGTAIDLEMQVRKLLGFRRRALYYLARSYSSQLARGQDYLTLRPAVLIAFLCYEETSAQRLHSIFEFQEIHDQRTFSKDLSLHLIELPKLKHLTTKEQEQEAALVRWAQFFAAATDEDLEAAAQGDQMMEKAMDYLEKLSSQADVRLLAERREMAQLMYKMELNLAREAGQAEGKAEGKTEGRAEGFVQGKRDALFRLLERRAINLTDEQRQEIESCTITTLLDRWFDQALTAGSADELDI